MRAYTRTAGNAPLAIFVIHRSKQGSFQCSSPPALYVSSGHVYEFLIRIIKGPSTNRVVVSENKAGAVPVLAVIEGFDHARKLVTGST